jgi:hypothetical protein
MVHGSWFIAGYGKAAIQKIRLMGYITVLFLAK